MVWFQALGMRHHWLACKGYIRCDEAQETCSFWAKNRTSALFVSTHAYMPKRASTHAHISHHPLRKSLVALSGCGTLADRLASISSGDSNLFYSIYIQILDRTFFRACTTSSAFGGSDVPQPRCRMPLPPSMRAEVLESACDYGPDEP